MEIDDNVDGVAPARSNGGRGGPAMKRRMVMEEGGEAVMLVKISEGGDEGGVVGEDRRRQSSMARERWRCGSQAARVKWRDDLAVV